MQSCRSVAETPIEASGQSCSQVFLALFLHLAGVLLISNGSNILQTGYGL